MPVPSCEGANEIKTCGDRTVQQYVLWYQQLGMGDVNIVGGKNASLGEMISNLANAGVQVPGGFADNVPCVQ